jgi:hypothetical protein
MVKINIKIKYEKYFRMKEHIIAMTCILVWVLENTSGSASPL